MADKDALPRITYESVMTAQRKVGGRIENLIKENRSLNPDEKWDFHTDWNRATLGIGSRIMLNYPKMPGSQEYSLDYVVFNLLSGGKSSVIVGWEAKHRQRNAPVSEVWNAVLIRLMGVVFGEALEMAAKMSPEKDHAKIDGGLTEGGMREWGRK